MREVMLSAYDFLEWAGLHTVQGTLIFVGVAVALPVVAAVAYTVGKWAYDRHDSMR